MNIIKTIVDHVKYWGELYFFAPISIALVYLSILGVNFVTGRQVLEDPASIVGWLYNLCGCVIVMVATGFAQNKLYGYRSKVAGAKLSDDIYDGLVTSFLLLLFSYLVWH